MGQATFVAAGDIFMTRRLPQGGYPGYRELCGFLRGFDVRFANLEVTVHDREGYPGAVSGGTWAMAHPSVLPDLATYGFNLYNAANNHSLDYSHNGLLATMGYLDAHNFLYAGVGRNLADAAAPVYLECPDARVALVAAVTSFPETWMAGQQRMDMPGRPGVNGLRVRRRYHVTAEQLTALRDMAGPLFINAKQELSVREGFAVAEEGVTPFGELRFVEDSRSFTEEIPHTGDQKRILAAIREAKSQADCVLVSLHSHEMAQADKDRPAEFLQGFARACIAAGASAVLGHGPHILRGIELYGGGVIFYSLGNFLFGNDTTTHQPADFYEKYKLPTDATVGQGMDARSKGDQIGLGADARVWESALPYFTIRDGQLGELRLRPIALGFGLPRYRRGLPALSGDAGVLRHLAALSESFGTKIELRDGEGVVRLP